MKKAVKFLAFWAVLILMAIINLEIIKNGGFCLTDTFLEGGWSYCRDVAKDSWPNMSYGFIYIYLLLTVFSGVGLFFAFFSKKQRSGTTESKHQSKDT